MLNLLLEDYNLLLLDEPTNHLDTEYKTKKKTKKKKKQKNNKKK